MSNAISYNYLTTGDVIIAPKSYDWIDRHYIVVNKDDDTIYVTDYDYSGVGMISRQNYSARHHYVKRMTNDELTQFMREFEAEFPPIAIAEQIELLKQELWYCDDGERRLEIAYEIDRLTGEITS